MLQAKTAQPYRSERFLPFIVLSLDSLIHVQQFLINPIHNSKVIVKMLESGGIDHPESHRNNQS